MALRGGKAYYLISRMPVRQWRRLALQTGVKGAFDEMVKLVEASADAIDRLGSKLPPGFPEYVWRSIAEGVKGHRKLFLDILPSLDENPAEDAG
jgi:hypothetical protein